ncbi:MAG: GNAT family N-acetyltransferase [Candidatus Dormibacteraeota bacterium]|nr:GNAT family N-acetyltransferase [Candidatus Dormibacteraeota bacterium]MBV9524338.1 GNAT family N-acetyltransferase [Candidatus Dormibacteraeota bacterium]
MPAEETLEGRTGAAVVVREVTLDTVLPLRHQVLRAGQPIDVARSKQDGLPGTVHYAAYEDDTVVGVVTQFPDDTDLAPGVHAERFRGMAVDPAWQGRGVGRVLMRAAVELARSRGAEVLWANGRDTALDFYTRIGFRVIGDGFVDGVMHLGHHVVLARLDELHP